MWNKNRLVVRCDDLEIVDGKSFCSEKVPLFSARSIVTPLDQKTCPRKLILGCDCRNIDYGIQNRPRLFGLIQL